MHPAYVVEAAQSADVPQLLELNAYWRARFSARELTNGFLYGVAFSEGEWVEMCGNGDVVVARAGKIAVGYYLVDEHSTSETGALHEAIRANLATRGLIPAQGVARRAQAVVSDAHHGRGLSRLLLDALIDHTSSRYRCLLGLVHDENPKLPAHQAVGWEVVDYQAPFHIVLLRSYGARSRQHQTSP